MMKAETEIDLFAQRKIEEEDPLRYWFYTELITQMFMRALMWVLEELDDS